MPSQGRNPGMWLAGSGTLVHLPGQLGCRVRPHSNPTALYCGMSNLPPATIYFHTLGLRDWVFCSLNVLSLYLPPAIVAFEVLFKHSTPYRPLGGAFRGTLSEAHSAYHHTRPMQWKGQMKGFRVKDTEVLLTHSSSLSP